MQTIETILIILFLAVVVSVYVAAAGVLLGWIRDGH
jgi:hypothetical protein